MTPEETPAVQSFRSRDQRRGQDQTDRRVWRAPGRAGEGTAGEWVQGLEEAAGQEAQGAIGV